MVKKIFFLVFFIGGVLIYGGQQKKELIRVKVKIGSSEYISYVQLSNREEPKNFKILRRID